MELKADYAKTRDPALIQEFVRDSGREGQLIQSCLFWDSLWNCEWDLADAIVDPLVICPKESWEAGPLHHVISGHQPSSDDIFQVEDRPDIVTWLINKGADIERAGIMLAGVTPLIGACFRQLQKSLLFSWKPERMSLPRRRTSLRRLL